MYTAQQNNRINNLTLLCTLMIMV